jgi:hypothetical protein
VSLQLVTDDTPFVMHCSALKPVVSISNIHVKTQPVPHSKRSVSVIKTNQLMLY